MRKKAKLVCRECGWRGKFTDVQHGHSPFGDKEPIIGCPDCDEISSMVSVCDEPGCKQEVTCGTPTKERYRKTCGEHRPTGFWWNK